MISYIGGFISPRHALLRIRKVCFRMRSLSKCSSRYARPVNVRKAQRMSSFTYIRAHRAIAMDSALNIKPSPPQKREAAILIKTSPIFRVYTRSDAPLWYRAFVAAFVAAFPLSYPLSREFLSYSFLAAAAAAASPATPLVL